MANRPFFIKPSILISIGLTAAIGAWLYSGADQDVQANTSDQITTTEENIDAVGAETALPSYKTSVRYIESQAQDHLSTLSITAQTQYDRKATVSVRKLMVKLLRLIWKKPMRLKRVPC